MNFPNSPTIGDTYTYGSKTWKWSGVVWELIPTPLTATDIPNLDTSKIVSGVFGVARGGVGISSLTAGNYLRAASSSTYEQRTAAQVLSDIGGLAASSYTAADMLSKLLTVGGASSALDADLLDGQHGAYYLNASNLASGSVPNARISQSSVTQHGSTVGNAIFALTNPSAVRYLRINADNTVSALDAATFLAAIGGGGGGGGGGVDLTTNQTIAGVKTFTDTPIVSSGGISIHALSGGLDNANLALRDHTGTLKGLVWWNRPTDELMLRSAGASDKNVVIGQTNISYDGNVIWHAGNVAATKTALGLTGTNSGDQTTITGNAGSATILQNARTIAISGPVTGTATSFNGSANITIPVTALDVGHANVTGTLAVARGGTGLSSYTTGNYINASGATTLQQRTPAQVLSDIGGAPLASPSFTGNVVSAGSISATSGNITSPQNFLTSTANVVVAPGSSGNVILRPAGAGSSTGELNVSTGGVTWNGSALVTLANSSTWTGSQVFGNNAGTRSVRVGGNASGSGGGSFLACDVGASTACIAIGNRSAIFGGTYDATPVIYVPGTLLQFDVGGGIRTTIESNGNVQTIGTFRSTGQVVAPSTGEGTELYYLSGVGYLIAYDRGGASWKPMSVYGSTVNFYAGGSLRGTVTADGVSDQRGNLRDIPVTVRNASASFTSADRGCAIVKDNTSSYNWTIDTSGAAGWSITVINAGTTGLVTIVRSGVSLTDEYGTNADFALGIGQSRTLLCLSSTVWRVL